MLPPTCVSRPASPSRTWPSKAEVVDLPFDAGDGDDLGAFVVGGQGVDRAGEEFDVAEDLDPGGAGLASFTVQCGSRMGEQHARQQHQGGEFQPSRSPARSITGQAFGRPAAAADGRLRRPTRPPRAPPASRAARAIRPSGPGRTRRPVLPSKPLTGITWFRPSPAGFEVARQALASMICHDPEPDDDGGLGPAEAFEMVMDRGHQEHPAAGALEP